MAKPLAIPSKDAQLWVIGSSGKYQAARIQRLAVNTTIPVDTKDELGNPFHAGETKDIPEITVTFSALNTGVKLYSALTGTDANAYPATGVDISKLGEVDVAIFVKDPQVQDYLKSIHGRRLQVRDFTYSFSVDGDATEEYTLIGSERRYLKYDVVVDEFTTGTTTFTLTNTPIPLKNGNKALSVILDGKYLDEVASSPASGQYAISGTTLTTGNARVNKLVVVYHANPSGNNWTNVGDNSMPASIRGKDTKVTIAANSIPRVQSISINGSLNVQKVSELGNRHVVGYQRQVPTIEGTLTVLDTDNELISLLTTGSISSTDGEFSPGEGCTISGLALKVELVKPCDTSSTPAVVKTIFLPDVTIVGDSYSVNVNGNAEIVFNFRSSDAQLIVYSGMMP